MVSHSGYGPSIGYGSKVLIRPGPGNALAAKKINKCGPRDTWRVALLPYVIAHPIWALC